MEAKSPEEGVCPLRSPPRVKRGLKSLNFLQEPSSVQKDILGNGDAAIGTWMGMRALFIGNQELARDVLVNQGSDYDVSNPPHFKYLLGAENMGLLNEPEHTRIRKFFTPSFTAAKVAEYLPRIEQICEWHAKNWAVEGNIPSWQDRIKLLTFDVICSVVGGFDWNPEELKEMSDAFGVLVAGISFPIPLELFGLTPFGKAMKARRKIAAAIKGKISLIKQGDASSQAKVGLLKEIVVAEIEGKTLSEDELVDNFIGLLIAGHDTTASSLSITLYYLSKTPSMMLLLRKEQNEVVRRFGTAITPSALESMPFTEACLKEGWRLHPVVPVVARSPKTDVALGSYSVKAGQPTFVALSHIAKTDSRWTDGTGNPDPCFDPRRFIGSNGESLEGPALVFGGGNRICLGMLLAMAEAKTVLSVIGRGFTYEIEDGAKISGFPFPTVHMNCNNFRQLVES